MKILFVANNNEIGGATKSMLELIGQESKKNQVIVVTPKKEKVYEFCQKNNIKVFVIKYDSYLISEGNSKKSKMLRKILIPILKLRHKILLYTAEKKLLKNMDIKSIDIIHTNMLRDDFGGRIARKYEKKHVVHLREFNGLDYKCYSLVRFNTIEYMNSYTTKFIAISNAIKDYYIKLGLPENKINVIYNGINIDSIKYKSKKDYNNKEPLKIVFSGGIIESKGQKKVLEAYNKLPLEIKNKFIIDIYGKGNVEYLKSIREFIDKNKLNNIHIYDYVDNIYEVLSQYDIGIMCSKAEAFGRVTIEYMLTGLITVVPDTGANLEIVDDKINGYIFEYNNMESLTKLLEYISNNINSMDNIVKNAKEKVLKNFTYEINAKKIMELYNRI